jgi:hypothetical protein
LGRLAFRPGDHPRDLDCGKGVFGEHVVAVNAERTKEERHEAAGVVVDHLSSGHASP